MSYIDIVSGGTSYDASTIRVDAHADYGYRICIEEHLFSVDNSALADCIAKRMCLVVVSATIDQLYGAQVRAYFAHHLDPAAYRVIVCASGEQNKTLDTVVNLCAEAKAFALDRDALFIAIGGGIILDMVGFAASMYRRGTKFIKVPTTLVGQVDVAVGVKTGVNAFRSKNILGNYYPAYRTFNDPHFLTTLPVRELRCGMAEVIKMALVCDAMLFEQIEDAYRSNAELDLARLDYAIYHRAMVRMVEELQPNLLEANLERVVDFGHTFSMALEIDSDHQILHGEAVAIDMALSCCIARTLGLLAPDACDRAIRSILNTGLSIAAPAGCTVDTLKRSVADVQLHRKAVNLVLPTVIGDAMFVKKAEMLSEMVLQTSLDMLADYAGKA